MPVYAEWDSEDHTIIRLHLHDPWELAEYIEASSQTRTMMLSVSYPVHLIVDLSDSFRLPKNLLRNVGAINSHILPDQGLVVAVKYSPYARAVMRVAMRVFPKLGRNVVFAHSLQEAYEIIRIADHKPPIDNRV